MDNMGGKRLNFNITPEQADGLQLHARNAGFGTITDMLRAIGEGEAIVVRLDKPVNIRQVGHTTEISFFANQEATSTAGALEAIRLASAVIKRNELKSE